jgi:hypothetical protein
MWTAAAGFVQVDACCELVEAVELKVDARYELVAAVDLEVDACLQTEQGGASQLQPAPAGCDWLWPSAADRMRLAVAGCVLVDACCELVAAVDLEVDARSDLVAAVDLVVDARLQTEKGGAPKLQPASASSSWLRPALAGCGRPALACCGRLCPS